MPQVGTLIFRVKSIKHLLEKIINFIGLGIERSYINWQHQFYFKSVFLLIDFVNKFLRKPVNLEAYNSAVIRDILTDAKYIESDAAWNLTLKVFLDVSGGISDLEGHLQASIALENGVVLRAYEFVKDSVLKRGDLEKELSIIISNVSKRCKTLYFLQLKVMVKNIIYIHIHHKTFIFL